MYTLPTRTSLRIRNPSKPLEELARMVMGHRFARLSVELTDYVTRKRRYYDGRIYRWYDFASGDVMPIHEPERHFEIEAGYGLFEYDASELTIFLTSFARTLDQVAALDIARDAFLDGRTAECFAIAREAVRHGWPLFLTLLQKERNLGIEG